MVNSITNILKALTNITLAIAKEEINKPTKIKVEAEEALEIKEEVIRKKLQRNCQSQSMSWIA